MPDRDEALLLRERFDLLAAATQDCLFDWDLATDRVWRNETYQARFGGGPGSAGVCDDPAWWEQHVHPEDRARVAARQAADLCQQILAYAGKGRFLVEPADLAAVVRSTLPLVRHALAGHRKARLECPAGLPPVHSAPGRGSTFRLFFPAHPWSAA